MDEKQIALTNELKTRLMVLETEAVTAKHPKGGKQHMDWIVGTTKYLSNLKKIIYDVSFLSLYTSDNRIPDGCFAVDQFVYKIDNWAYIDSPERFKEVLEASVPPINGTAIYLDNVLYLKGHMSFAKFDAIRNEILRKRTDGEIWFECMKCIDPNKNETLFLPSRKAKRKHMDQELLKIIDNVLSKKKDRPISVKKEARPARN